MLKSATDETEIIYLHIKGSQTVQNKFLTSQISIHKLIGKTECFFAALIEVFNPVILPFFDHLIHAIY